jgi:Skp family chaperone for outer membrane proteins
MEKYSVKKTILALGLAVLMLGSLTGRVQAQPSTGTRVAVVNVGLVFSKYQKAIFYKAELENTLKPFKAQGEKIAADMKTYGEAIKNKNYKDAKMKDDYEQYFLKLKRDMEDLDGRARKLIGSKQEEQIITLFKEVTGAIQAFAQANGYHLVLGYGQQIDGDMYSIANINRIMQGMDLGSTTPLFLVGGVDISQPVVDTLNRHYQGAAGATPGIVPASATSNHK